ncbi:transmembrane protease serine 9-like [Gigantopelta aegis]|uniref:transmembrane protease serine 9-like n=1 Tax=Gigantopelta aegis TaxID=1735272 RepID=UPI001B88A1FE|nr:transmembrane protease serine 9-like [Gigantopelta aegis]
MAGCGNKSTRVQCVVVVIAVFFCLSSSQDARSLCQKYANYCKLWKKYIDVGYKSLQVYYDLCECSKQAQCGYSARYCSVWLYYIKFGYNRLQILYDRCDCDKLVTDSTTASSTTLKTTTEATTTTTSPTTTTTSPTTTTSKPTTTTTVLTTITATPQQCGVSSKIEDPSEYLKSSVLRIVGGNAATECEFPWMVIIKIDSFRMCSGSLIDDRHVITAGHCVRTVLINPGSVKIGLGSSNKQDGGAMQYISVSRIFRHPAYTRDFDKNSDQRPDILQEVKLPIMSQSACSNVYTHYDDSKICAGYPQGGKDACEGDSGGPLACAIDNKWVMVGSVSYGLGCARPGYPGVYTYVPNYYSWIDEIRNA